MNRILKIAIFLFVASLILSAGAHAQGFSAVLDKLDKLETRLDDLEAQYKKDFKGLKSSSSRSSSSVDLSKIENSVADLSSEVAEIRSNSANRENVELAEISGLTTDLRGLVGEIKGAISQPMGMNAGSGGEQSEEPVQLEISGFGDVYSAVRQSDGGSDDFEIGQIEVDLETNIDQRIVVAAAIAYEAEAGAFGLGAFTVDFHLFGSEGDHFRPLNGIDHSGMIVGQFDIPFGIDWHVYPSIDRKLVSAPLAVESSHDGWNDYGVQFYVENSRINAVVYGANGFGYEYANDTLGNHLGYNGWGYDPEDESLDIQQSEMKTAFGGRLGIKPHEWVELGGSYAGFVNQESDMDMSLFGADLQLSYNNFSAKGEYIVHSIGLADTNEVANTGYYAQGMYEFGSYFLVARYGAFTPDLAGSEDITRLSMGGGWALMDGCELRFEYQDNSDEDSDEAFLQLVVGF